MQSNSRHASYIFAFVFASISLLTLTIWQDKNINGVTGDEPHYLVISSGIVNHFSLEQTKPYAEEFKWKNIFPPGLAPQNALPNPSNTHAAFGPNGLFNVHNIGLPIILTIPFLFGGVLASKLTMIALNSIIFIIFTRILLRRKLEKKIITFAVLPFAISANFVLASSQIYPDLLAGLIILFLFVRTTDILENRNKFPQRHNFLWFSLLSLLPWLQLKYIAPALLLFFYQALKMRKNQSKVNKILISASPFIISLLLLATYNEFAFGNLLGPYKSDALQISTTALMVGFGLFLDQNQGMFFQNPLLLTGFFYLVHLIIKKNGSAVLGFLLISSIILPNSMHPNWYGGGSFAGRFTWSVIPILSYFSICYLTQLFRSSVRLFYWITTLAICYQCYLWMYYAIFGVNIYNKQDDPWQSSYSIFFPYLSNFLPSFYNSSWAFQFIPNIFLISVILLISMYIIFNKYEWKAKTSILITFAAGTLIYQQVQPLIIKVQPQVKFWSASVLPSQTGRIADTVRVADPNSDKAGFLTFGPYEFLAPGDYIATIKYRSKTLNSQDIGYMDVYDNNTAKKLETKSLILTNGFLRESTIGFRVSGFFHHRIEIRTFWSGTTQLEVVELQLKPS
jgi:hypothetical protein